MLPLRAGISSEPGWPHLTLVRRRDRRLLFVELIAETGTISSRKRQILELLGSLEWDRTDDEQRQAELALGHAVPRIETFIWRPSDLMAGTIERVLR